MADQAEEHKKNELKKHTIADFFQSATLSDITISNPLTGAQYKYFTSSLILY